MQEITIPEPIVAALGDWVKQMAEEAATPARNALAQSDEQLQAVTAARDQALATLAQRDEEIEQLNAELRNARHIATDALVGKAKDQLAIEGKESQLADLRAQIERNVAASAALSDARLAAEMELVGAVTARDNYAAEIKELRARLSSRAG
jgi:DNA repair exonuclease SbcCD ATPase subunit